MSLPNIVKFAYEKYEIKDGKHLAVCNICKITIREKAGTTSGFLRHIRSRHKNLFNDYGKLKTQRIRKICREKSIPELLVGEHHISESARQRQITNALLNMLVGELLPFNILESEDMRKLFTLLDPEYPIPSTRQLTEVLIPKAVESKLTDVKNLFRDAQYVSLSIDMWTDWNQYSFLAVTGHIYVDGRIKSVLASFKTFKGPYAGMNVVNKLDHVINQYDLSKKIKFIVCDSTVDIKRVANFVCEIEDTNIIISNDDSVGFDEVCLEETDYTSLIDAERLPCFTHSLQLVVKDGLQHMKSSNFISKCTKLAYLVHRNALFKFEFERVFCEEKLIPLADDKRWKSLYHQMRHISRLDRENLSDILDRSNNQELKLSSHDFEELEEFIFMFEHLEKVANLSQTDQGNSISCVAPFVFYLWKSLQDMLASVRHYKSTVTELLRSIEKHFYNLFWTLGVRTINCEECKVNLNFQSEVFFCASAIDPNHGFRWLKYISNSEEEITNYKDKITGMLMKYIVRFSDEDTLAIAKERMPRNGVQLMLYGEENRERTESICEIMQDYLAMINYDDKENEELKIWIKNSKFKQLWPIFNCLVSVPAVSAPVERIFSNSGYVLNSFREPMSNEKFDDLMFLKCNKLE